MDTSAFHFDLKDIIAHTHKYHQKVAETEYRYLRLQEKWNLNRSKLKARTQWPVELMQEWQLEKVSNMVDYAFNCIPFYKKLYGQCGFTTGDIINWDNFNELPHISKKDIIKNFPEQVILPGVNYENCYQARTSGSTGVPMTIVRDSVSTESWMMNRMRQFEQMTGESIQTTDWIYNIYLSTWAFNSFAGDYPVFSISENCPPIAVAEHLKLLRPKIISAFPSFLRRLQPYIQDLSKYGVKCICTNSESSTRKERDVFQAHFGVPVLDEYASEELSIIATECPHGNYHVVEDRVRVDVINQDQNGFGDILGTDMSNTYMPLIRYSQGDLIQWTGEAKPCACGSKFRYIKRFLGRADQTLESKERGRIPADLMMNLCDRTLVPIESGLAEFRICQTNLNTLKLLAVLRKEESEITPTVLARFRKSVYDLFGYKITIQIEYYAEIPKLSSYKRRMIINEI